MTKHVYKSNFFNYVNSTSLRSATHFLQTVQFPFEIESVLDIGCGKGAWLSQWQKKYTENIFGLDGDYVDVDSLLIPKNCFQAVDLRQSIDLNRKFSIVECLEVAEHLDNQFADILVENIIRHGDIILFSAAQKGQGGKFHVNEQPIFYWVEKFAKHNYVCFDYIRPQIKGKIEIEPWYRFNMILFIHQDKLSQMNLNHEFLSTRVSSNYDFTQLIDSSWLLRNRILSLLPYSLINQLSKIKQHILPMIKK